LKIFQHLVALLNSDILTADGEPLQAR